MEAIVGLTVGFIIVGVLYLIAKQALKLIEHIMESSVRLNEWFRESDDSIWLKIAAIPLVLLLSLFTILCYAAVGWLIYKQAEAVRDWWHKGNK